MKHLTLLFLLFPTLAYPSESIKTFKGEWTGYSKVIYSLFGDLNIDDNNFTFEKLGKFEYNIINIFEETIVVELKKHLDCGKYIKLILLNGHQIEFSIYESKKDALAGSNYCVWGLYTKIK